MIELIQDDGDGDDDVNNNGKEWLQRKTMRQWVAVTMDYGGGTNTEECDGCRAQLVARETWCLGRVAAQHRGQGRARAVRSRGGQAKPQRRGEMKLVPAPTESIVCNQNTACLLSTSLL